MIENSLYFQQRSLRIHHHLLSQTPLPPLSSQLFLSHSPRYSTGLTDSPFESKAIALVQAIKDKEVSQKANCTL